MSFEGVKDLDKLINDEISSLDKLIFQSSKDLEANVMARNVLKFKTVVNESCSDVDDQKENELHEQDILYPDEERVRNSFRSLTNLLPHENNKVCEQTNTNIIRRSMPGPVNIQVQSRYSTSCMHETKEESQPDFGKCQKEPLKELKNCRVERNPLLKINECRDYSEIYEEEEEENEDEEVNDYIDKLRKAKNLSDKSYVSQKESDNKIDRTKDNKHLNYEQNQRNTKQNKCINSDYQFIGSSFGKHSIPAIKEIVNQKQLNSIVEPNYAEMKYSEEVKLTESNDSK